MADFETREMPRDDSQEREEAAAEAAMDVAALAADDLPDAAELTFEEKLAELNRTVMRHPLNREILYKTLPSPSAPRSARFARRRTSSRRSPSSSAPPRTSSIC